MIASLHLKIVVNTSTLAHGITETEKWLYVSNVLWRKSSKNQISAFCYFVPFNKPNDSQRQSMKGRNCITCRNVKTRIWARYGPGYCGLWLPSTITWISMLYIDLGIFYILGHVQQSEIYMTIPWKNLKNQGNRETRGLSAYISLLLH